MQTATKFVPVSRKKLRAGHIISALPALLMLFASTGQPLPEVALTIP